MCDTLVALGSVTQDGSVILAKNSDREPNEAHEVLVIPRQSYPNGNTLKCTYIEIPQARETFAVLLSKPFWMWGAEMGSNEHGVTIGNEAVFTKIPYQIGPALTGMDLLRLALERSDSARSAVDLITGLLDQYGQGGNCGFASKFYYHNSFLIADPREAWVLETADRHWAAFKVESFYTISNAITIGKEWDLASKDLVEHALERGWCKSKRDFHFASCYSDLINTRFSDARKRQPRTIELLEAPAKTKSINVQTMMQILRDHGREQRLETGISEGLMGCDVCLHAGFGPIRINQTTGSLVSHLAHDVHTHWVTATSAPCLSVFKPVWIEAGVPDHGPAPQGTYDPDSLWWQQERLNREVIRDYVTRSKLISEERQTLEAKFISEAEACRNSSLAERAELTARCFAQSREATDGWIDRVRAAPLSARHNVLFKSAWKTFNKKALYPHG
jgi:secernin